MIWILIAQLAYIAAWPVGGALIWTVHRTRALPWAAWTARLLDEIAVRTTTLHHHPSGDR